ncbi:MAG: hypothetical protein BAJALOKI3v1_620017 [Promethearchaeota archaeon]|nr:MAG: hypothetical protein BAJALOKI3v1_620017 [Candidatus Lokiarchaeota archaeon]
MNLRPLLFIVVIVQTIVKLYRFGCPKKATKLSQDGVRDVENGKYFNFIILIILAFNSIDFIPFMHIQFRDT